MTRKASDLKMLSSTKGSGVKFPLILRGAEEQQLVQKKPLALLHKMWTVSFRRLQRMVSCIMHSHTNAHRVCRKDTQNRKPDEKALSLVADPLGLDEDGACVAGQVTAAIGRGLCTAITWRPRPRPTPSLRFPPAG